MKSFFILLLIAALAALLTVPGQDKFDKYLAKKGKDAAVCIGGKRHYSYKLFSIDYVDYCEAGVITSQPGLRPLPGLNKTRTDKYLGLFGTFWKL
jgi:hypothetical protein